LHGSGTPHGRDLEKTEVQEHRENEGSSPSGTSYRPVGGASEASRHHRTVFGMAPFLGWAGRHGKMQLKHLIARMSFLGH
jgi:hypothetical protein